MLFGYVLAIFTVALSLAAQPSDMAQSVKNLRGFENPERLLQELVRQKGHAPLNHFCVVGYRDNAGDISAWVYWAERGDLILWEPSLDKPAPLWQSRRYLDAKRDIVSSDADLRGSTYRVTRTWAERVQRDCKQSGDQYTIRQAPRVRTLPKSGI